MSVWVSICGDDPRAYEDSDGPELDDRGWIDVATSCVSDRVRIFIEEREGLAQIILDPEGLAELHRRIVVARDLLNRSPK